MRIAYFADHQDIIPLIAEWFYREWSSFYRDKTIDDVQAAIAERINRNTIPLALVAFAGGTSPALSA
jgi:hypothetical protein